MSLGLVGTTTILEANASSNRNFNRFRGRERKSRRGSHKSGGRPAQNNNNNNNNPRHRNALAQNHNKGNKPMRKHDDNACSCYGVNEHWTCACHTPKHFINLYQASIKGKSKIFETNFIENAYDTANIEVNNALVEEFLLPWVMITPLLL